MSKNSNLAQRLKEQKERESAITQDLMQKQLSDMRSELSGILRQELNTIKADIQSQSQSIGWSMFKSRVLWPTVVGLSLCIGILGGSWGVTQYLANKAMNLSHEIASMNQNIKILEAEGGKIQFNRCGDQRRLCVKIDEGATTYQGGYRILKGY